MGRRVAYPPHVLDRAIAKRRGTRPVDRDLAPIERHVLAAERAEGARQRPRVDSRPQRGGGHCIQPLVRGRVSVENRADSRPIIRIRNYGRRRRGGDVYAGLDGFDGRCRRPGRFGDDRLGNCRRITPRTSGLALSVGATIDAGARAASVLADGAGGGTAVFAAAASFGRAAAVGGATAGFAGGSGCLVSGAAVTGGLVGGAVAVADEAAGAGSGSGGDGRNVGYSSPRAMPIAAAPATLSSIIQRFEDGE
jgi:hypothetical protein